MLNIGYGKYSHPHKAFPLLTVTGSSHSPQKLEIWDHLWILSTLKGISKDLDISTFNFGYSSGDNFGSILILWDKKAVEAVDSQQQTLKKNL